MALARCSRFVYGGSGDFSTSLPARIWDPSDETIGGVTISAAGIPASYIVRRDVLIDLPIRFTEAEWTDILALVTFGQTGEDFDWYPDAAGGTNFDVYLQSPAAGERWAPTRDAQYPRVLEVTLTLRGEGTDIPWLPYFDT